MCGILGYIAINKKVESTRFEQALDYMAHRGPDFQGIKQIENITLGHRRLSIIDLSNIANQPFIDADENLAIIYNGEIYNYVEIKEALINLGYTFKTKSDTEVIVKAYKAWGEECLSRFNGMFAFFIYDYSKKKGFGARDRFGVKPFYYYKNEDAFIFSSEIKPLLHFGIAPTVNMEYLNSFIVEAALDYGNKTLINEINQLEAGQYFIVENSHFLFQKWWTNDNLKIDLPKSYEERVRYYKETFFDAVKIRLRSDVNNSLTLSGGMDSTSIYSAYNSLRKDNNSISERKLDIFTIEYNEGSGVDETEAVKEITSSFGDKFNAIPLSSDNVLSRLREAIYFQEFPAWNISSITYQEIYKHVRNSGDKVLLEGHGNDEILGGYKNHVNLSVSYFLKAFAFKKAWAAAKIFSQMNNVNIGQKSISPMKCIIYNALPFVRKIREKHLLKSLQNKNLWSFALYRPFQNRSKNPLFSGFQNELLHLVNTSILPTVLRVFDRATMASSIEMRAPFMDYRLIQIAFSINEYEKIGGKYQKRILRDSMTGLMPDSIRTNIVKKGFSGDLITWFNNPTNSGLINNIIDMIHPSIFINKEEVKKFYDKNLSSGFNWDDAIIFSRVLSFIVWYDLFINKEYKNLK